MMMALLLIVPFHLIPVALSPPVPFYTTHLIAFTRLLQDTSDTGNDAVSVVGIRRSILPFC